MGTITRKVIPVSQKTFSDTLVRQLITNDILTFIDMAPSLKRENNSTFSYYKTSLCRSAKKMLLMIFALPLSRSMASGRQKKLTKAVNERAVRIKIANGLLNWI